MYWKCTFNANFSYKVPGDDHKCGRVFDLHIENSAYVCAWEENFSNDLHFLTVFKYTFQYATLSISEIFKSWLFLVTESIKCCSSSRCKHFSNLQLFWMNKRSFIALYPDISNFFGKYWPKPQWIFLVFYNFKKILWYKKKIITIVKQLILMNVETQLILEQYYFLGIYGKYFFHSTKSVLYSDLICGWTQKWVIVFELFFWNKY